MTGYLMVVLAIAAIAAPILLGAILTQGREVEKWSKALAKSLEDMQKERQEEHAKKKNRKR